MKNGKYAARRSSGTKGFALLLALMLVVGCSVGTTLAWLVSQPDAVVNTFTVGNINLELKEHLLKNDGTLDTTSDDCEVTENDNYKVVPGATQPKDPFVTVQKGSEKCYVYVTIKNSLKAGTVAAATPDISTTDWVVVQTEGDTTLYRYKDVVDASAADVKLQVFNNITYAATITKANLSALTGNIELKAFAHQSMDVTSETANAGPQAWSAITNPDSPTT